MKKSKIYELHTPYETKVGEEIPWNEYPRPQFRRNSFFCLNGEWDFGVCKVGGEYSFDEKITVPFSPESKLSGIGREIPKNSLLCYRRKFTLPYGFMKKRLFLHFGAVDQTSQIFVNGKLALEHEGGYTPFFADITELYREGENELTVFVRDELSLEYPYGKQRKKRGGMWYTPVSGIWQTVWLESVPEGYIENIKITPTKSSVQIKVKTGAKRKSLTVKATGEIFEFEGDEIIYAPEEPRLWSPENPYLYEIEIKAGEDMVESYFALREIGVKSYKDAVRLTLNGEPYLFNGLLDQGYYSDGIFLPATKEGYENDIRLAKSLGFNTLRKHIKIEPLIFYHLCDKLGIVVFQDAVNNSSYSFIRDTALPTIGLKRLCDKNMHRNERSRELFRRTLTEMQELLYNTPSVLVYTIFNEGWGQFCADDNYELARKNDSTRLYDATSGWFWQRKSDFDSEHVYFKPLKVKSFNERPVFISEFGGYSHRVKGHVFSDKNYGYKTFKSQDDYENAVIKLYTEEVLPLVKRGVSALVYTQLSDVEDETNGFITYDRQTVKVNEEKISKLMHKIRNSIKQ